MHTSRLHVEQGTPCLYRKVPWFPAYGYIEQKCGGHVRYDPVSLCVYLILPKLHPLPDNLLSQRAHHSRKGGRCLGGSAQGEPHAYQA